MKIFEYTTIHTAILQMLLPLGIYLGISSDAEWYWWALCIFFFSFVYVVIGNNVSFHRYFTHRYFTVTKPVEYFFLWCGSMIGIGGPISYALTHIAHHKYADTPLDPHGPIRGIRSWLMCFTQTVDLSKTPLFSKNIVKLSKSYSWIHQYYLLFLLGNAALLYSISYKAFLFLWFIPASLACWCIGIAVWIQHYCMKPNNHRWAFLYEGLHKNHHDYPLEPNTAIHKGEIDWIYQISKIFMSK